MKQNITNKDDFLSYYQKLYEEEARKKHEIDRNIIEKGMMEQMEREKERQRQEYINKQMVSASLKLDSSVMIYP